MATDNFNRAGPGLGANWTGTTSEDVLVISASTVATANALTSDCGDWWNANSFANDQYSQAILATIASAGFSGTGCGVSVREANGARTYYRVVAWADGTELGKVVTGTFTSLATDGGPWANGDTIRIEVSGTTITVKRNGATISALTKTDSAIASGRAGIKYSSVAGNTPTLDDWDGGDLSSGPTSAQLAGVLNQHQSGSIIGRVDA